MGGNREGNPLPLIFITLFIMCHFNNVIVVVVNDFVVGGGGVVVVVVVVFCNCFI